MKHEKTAKDFYSGFEKTERELLVLTAYEPFGAVTMGKYANPVVRVLATADPKTGEVDEQGCLLEWLHKSGSFFGGWGFSLKSLTVYRVRVRRSTTPPGEGWFQKQRYLLTKIVRRKVKNAALSAIAARYDHPLIVRDEKLGDVEFKNDRGDFHANITVGSTDWDVSLVSDDNNLRTADRASAAFLRVRPKLEQLEKRIREFAAEKLTELANDWREEEGEEITKEAFARRITPTFIEFSDDGTFIVMCDDDDMFLSHVIVIEFDENDEPVDTNLMG